MDSPVRQCDSETRRPTDTWTRKCCIAAVLIFAVVVDGVLGVSSELFDGSWRRGGREHIANNTFRDKDAGVVGAVATSGGNVGPHTPRRMQGQDLVLEETSGNGTLGEGLMVKIYPSFAHYVVESSENLTSLPVPMVKLVGRTSFLSIPIITIIGVQKGGTTNMRHHLMTHPMVWGTGPEVHFFDQDPSDYPQIGQWEGDGLGTGIGIKAAGKVLFEYARACVTKGTTYLQRKRGALPTDRVIVDASPRYIFNPLVPYRIKMVRPGAKFVLLLRNPTDRYFSQLRMEMCKTKCQRRFSSMEEQINTTYHLPGGAKDYLARADEGYEPYTALCRGENASDSDLFKCFQALEVSGPLYRGLYADQLERWLRVFDRSQIMVLDASEMLTDIAAVVTAVAEFAGLPAHTFQYDPSHEHKTGCTDKDHLTGRDYFIDGGRYEKMVEEVELFREWYRPHNERLYKLLGRDFMW